MNYDGGCLCGGVRFRVSGPLKDSGYCHCRMCQKNSGAPVIAWTTFGAADFRWLQGKPGVFESSATGRRQFCSRCGSYLVFSNPEHPSEVSVNTACFDEPMAFPPRKHIFAESRIGWFRTADELPSHVGYGASSTDDKRDEQ